ncbi:MAG TPA: bestrophin family ion channel, partial [Flavobacteriales bacterium]|nr:bestrophin family ion channel [Flavobacteriales bacterium]
MHAGRRYTFTEFVLWMRRDSYWLLLIATIPTLLHAGLGLTWLSVPWVPIALIGTASAFLVGFRNNATYARVWEARQIYGAIVNTSRAWGILVRDFIRHAGPFSEPEAIAVRKQLVHRHIAWLTALRYQLRQPRPWESMSLAHNKEYRAKWFKVEELEGDLATDLTPLLSAEDKAYVLAKSNRATQLIALSSAQLARLHALRVLEDNHHIALERVLVDLYEQQGRCERIKNFPYPRQFATLNLFFIRLFVWLAPLGLLGEFAKLGSWQVWLTIPFGFLIGWVFTAMERIGEASENPFEGNANDVP